MPIFHAAVCLCGQFRDHFAKVYDSMNSALLRLDGIEVDVFVETWLDECTRGVEWLAAYPNLTSLSMERLTPNAGWNLHGVSMPSDFDEKFRQHDLVRKHMLSTLPHLWMMRRCSEAVERWERSNNMTYDAIVKARPDSAFWHAPRGVFSSLPALTRHVVHGDCPDDCLYHFLDQTASSYLVSDKYAVGTSRAMHWYLRGWDTLAHIVATEPERCPPSTERLLPMHLQRARANGVNITMKRIPIEGRLQARAAAGSTLWRASQFAPLHAAAADPMCR